MGARICAAQGISSVVFLAHPPGHVVLGGIVSTWR